MLLKFYAKGACLVRLPGVTELIGTAPTYIGRYRAQLTDGRFAYPASEREFSVDANTAVARRLVKLTARDNSLWPADRATANACGVPFVAVELKDGEWVPAKGKQKPPKPDSD